MQIRPEWTENRELILKDRYLYQDEKTWEDLVERVNNAVEVDIKEELLNFDFVPAGRMLSGLGTNTTKTFFNCYVLDFENIGDGKDSRSAIMDLKRRAVEISARGGGLGVNWSSLRPRDSKVNKVNGVSSGTVSWMHTLNSDIEQVTQGGSRRGAMMFGLEPWHPDILEFITVKENLDKLNNANLSVFVSDDFMNAVKKDLDWNLEFPDTKFDKYDDEWDGNLKLWKEKNYPVIIHKTLKANVIYDLICKMAHNNGEPGIVFLERYNKLNITKDYERLISTNPCIVGDTLVITDKGEMTIKECIDIQKSGKEINILSYNLDTNKNEFKQVVWGDKTKENTDIIELEIEDDKGKIHKLKCTPDHQIYTKNRGKIEALLLINDDKIILNNNKEGIIRSIEFKDNEDVYDITVEDNHNFYANNILISNCGEIGLPSNGVCNLASINLVNMIKNNNINYPKLGKTIHKTVEFLDEIIDINPYYQQSTKNHQKQFRKIGLSIMGLADMLILLKMNYSDKSTLIFVEKLMSFIQSTSFLASAKLAKEKGPAPVWNDSMLENKYIKQLTQNVYDEIKKYGLRVTRIITCAPTGTTSRLAGVSSGIEPNFAYEYTIHDRIGDRKEYHWLYEKRKELELEDDLFICSSDLTPKQHIDMQAVCQKYIDSSISKCIAKNTLIYKDNELKYLDTFSNNRINDSFKDIENEFVINKNNEKEKINQFYFNGIKKCKKITLNNGIQLEGTLNHRILNDNDIWIKLKDIKINQQLKVI